ncbi:hypothetical protein BN973_02181 [Mycobacterium triplex]|uniref:Uncharacterized protein n=1 Tax=Mycobacterium triplex TaxID=47839 RepID=A0A024JX58_9MYCO|nr:hypothetical protein BN973_02181 [Mycobacterium triplex]
MAVAVARGMSIEGGRGGRRHDRRGNRQRDRGLDGSCRAIHVSHGGNWFRWHEFGLRFGPVSVAAATVVECRFDVGWPSHRLVADRRPSIVGSVDLQSQLRLLAVTRIVTHAIVSPQALEIHRDACRHELRQSDPQRSNAVLALGIQRHRGVLLAGQTLADEICQHTAGTDLDECPGAGPPHRLNLFDEPDRLSDLVGERGPHLLRVTGIRLRCRVGVDGYLWHAERDPGEEGTEWNRCRADDVGVEGGSDIQPARVDAGRGESLCRVIDGGAIPGQHSLIGSVVVGDDDRQAPLPDQLTNLLDGRGHRAHRSVAVGGGFGHQLTALARDLQGHLAAENTGGT